MHIFKYSFNQFISLDNLNNIIFLKKISNKLNIFNLIIKKKIGDWGLGIGDWGLGIGD